VKVQSNSWKLLSWPCYQSLNKLFNCPSLKPPCVVAGYVSFASWHIVLARNNFHNLHFQCNLASARMIVVSMLLVPYQKALYASWMQQKALCVCKVFKVCMPQKALCVCKVWSLHATKSSLCMQGVQVCMRVYTKKTSDPLHLILINFAKIINDALLGSN
jgi:hypothetical protein